MSCDCTKKVNKKLEKEMGVRLDEKMTFSTKPKAKIGTSPPLLQVHWVGTKPRGKSLPIVACTYCPFCGKKYED